MENNLRLDKLRENELPGADTINPMIVWMQHMGVLSDLLNITPNNDGSVSLDFDFALCASEILKLIPTLKAEFLATIEGSTLKVAGGHVYLPGHTYTLADYSHVLGSTSAGKGLSIVVGESTATYSWDTASYSIDTSAKTMTLPLCSIVNDGGTLRVQHHHIGAYVFSMAPEPLIAGYDRTKLQSLDHTTGGGMVWTSYKLCDSNGNA